MKLEENGLDSSKLFYIPPSCEEHGIEMELDLEPEDDEEEFISKIQLM